MNILADIFRDLTMLLIIINVFVYALTYKKNRNTLTYNIFSLYLLYSIMINMAVITLAFFKENNLFLSHYYFILQFIILSLFYKTLLKKNQQRFVTFFFIPVITILTIQYATSPELYFKFNTTEVFITCFPIIVYSMIHLYNSLNKPPKYMYINIGVLIYLTTSTLIFILGDYLTSSGNRFANNIWLINKVLYVVYLLLIFTEWWKNFRVIKNK